MSSPQYMHCLKWNKASQLLASQDAQEVMSVTHSQWVREGTDRDFTEWVRIPTWDLTGETLVSEDTDKGNNNEDAYDEYDEDDEDDEDEEDGEDGGNGEDEGGEKGGEEDEAGGEEDGEEHRARRKVEDYNFLLNHLNRWLLTLNRELFVTLTHH